MVPEPQTRLRAQQNAAQKAHDRMLDALIAYDPCGKLMVDDARYIARLCQTLAFEALKECEE